MTFTKQTLATTPACYYTCAFAGCQNHGELVLGHVADLMARTLCNAGDASSDTLLIWESCHRF